MSRDMRILCEQLYLRPPRRHDFKCWSRLRMSNKDHLQPWEPRWPNDASSRADWHLRMRAWQKDWAKGRGYAFLLFDKDDERLLGGVAITQIRRGAALSGSLGYWLGAEFTGHGFMSEAVSGVCKWAKAELRLARLEASTLPENSASKRVLERCGFLEEGYARSYLEIAGTRRDHVLYGLDLQTLK